MSAQTEVTPCALCNSTGWISHDTKIGFTHGVVHGLLAIGTPTAEIQPLVDEIHEKSIVRDEGTTHWFCSVPCINCNKDASRPAPEMHYYRLWSDDSRNILIALENEDGRHLTRAEFDELCDDSLEEE